MKQAQRVALALALGAFTGAAAITACGPPAATAPAGPSPDLGSGDPSVVVASPDGDAGALPVEPDAGAGEVTAPREIDRVIAGSVDTAAPAGVALPTPKPPPPVGYPLDLTSARDGARIVNDIQQLEELVRSTSKAARDYPRLLHRLAHAYRELAFAGRRDGQGSGADHAEQQSITRFEELRTEFPKFCASGDAADPMRSTGCHDETLYLIGRGHQRLGADDAMRAAYQLLLRDWPSSTYVPAVYFAFGELFVARADQDPTQLELAEKSFTAAISASSPEQPLFGPALYRLALIDWRRGDLARALSQMKKSIEHGQLRPALPTSPPLLARARADLLAIYAVTGEGRRAHEFIRPLSGDGSGASNATFAMMATLSGYYVGQGAAPEAVAVLQDLDARSPPGRCARAVDSAELFAFGLGADPDQLAAELTRVIDVAHEDDPACRAAAFAITASIVLAWDLRQVGSARAPGPRDRRHLDHLIKLYGALATGFTDDDVAAARLPRLHDADPPTRARLAARAAELQTLRAGLATP